MYVLYVEQRLIADSVYTIQLCKISIQLMGTRGSKVPKQPAKTTVTQKPLPTKLELELGQLHRQLQKLAAQNKRASQFIHAFFKRLARADEYKLNQPNELLLEGGYTFRIWEYPIKDPMPSPMCSKGICNSQDKRVFRCYDCQLMDNTILCYECFTASDHTGHNFMQYESTSGACDCGNIEMWKESGFCNRHRPGSLVVNINQELRDSFVLEFKFPLFLYFWLHQHSTSALKKEGQQLGREVFKKICELVNLNYDLKLFIARLMASNLKEFPPYLNSVTILEKIFNCEDDDEQVSVLKAVWFQLFPVDEFRRLFLTEYFKKSRTNKFSLQHPLKQVNFQFLTCHRLISEMIESKQLQPLQLNPEDPPSDRQEMYQLCTSFKRYYQDLLYLSKQTGGQYPKHHFALTNISDMGFYRKYTLLKNGMPLIRDMDQFFLKTLGQYTKHIIGHKSLLQKALSNLCQFIANNDEYSISLAQERAFAMITLAYYGGDLSPLNDPEEVKKFLKVIGMQQQEQSKQLLTDAITLGLKNRIHLGMITIPEQKDSYERYFLKMHPEKHFLFYLDMLYHRILMTISRDILDYQSVLVQLIQGQLAGNVPMERVSLCLSFVTQVVCIDVDEIVIGCYLGLPYSQNNMANFLNKTISSVNGKLNPKQFRQFIEQFLTDPTFIEHFISHHLTFQKGRFQLIQPDKQLPSIPYQHLFQEYEGLREMPQVTRVSTDPVLQRFKGIRLLPKEFIRQIFPFLIQKTDQNTKKTYLVDYLISSLIMLYYMSPCQQISQLLQGVSSSPKVMQKLSKVTGKQLAYAFTHPDKLQAEQKNDSDSKRRDKIQQKKRQKQLMMKKNQKNLLSQYKHMQEEEAEAQTCIYCKEAMGSKDIYLISYVGLTNLISSKILKDDTPHLFFSSCGHTVHKACYRKYLEQKMGTFGCFLCKRSTNIILPSLSDMKLTQQEQAEAIKQFLGSVQPALIEQNVQTLDSLSMFQKNYGNDIVAALVLSVAKELVFNQLHNEQSYQLNSFKCYKWLLSILGKLPQEDIVNAYQKIYAVEQSFSEEQQHPLTRYTYYALRSLGRRLIKNESADNCPHMISEDIANFIDRKIAILTGEQCESVHDNPPELKLITPELLFAFSFPDHLQQFHSHMGECPNCKNITNWMYICLLCGWKACSDCIPQLHRHTKKDHLEGTIFILTSNGRPNYLHAGSAHSETCLYQNEFGEEYSQSREHQNKLERFRLQSHVPQKMYKAVLGHEIHNRAM